MISPMNEPIEKKIRKTEALYDVGDYKAARQLAIELDGDPVLEETDRTRVRRILKATQSDSVVIMAIIFSFLVLVFLVLKYAF